MAVAPRQNLAFLPWSRTWALGGGKDGPDQMMADSAVVFHPSAFRSRSAQTGHVTF